MPANKRNTSGLGPALRMRRYRSRLRAEGLKPAQVWVYDTKAPGFEDEAKRQSLLASQMAGEQEMLKFMAHAFDSTGWT